MDTPTQTATYLGREIKVSAYEVRRGVWEYVYLVDRRDSGRSATGARLPDAESALRRGMLAAQARVDEMG